MRKRFLVIGLGRFGATLARQLSALGAEVLAIDRDPVRVRTVADEVALAVTGDATDPHVLEDQNVEQVECAIVATGERFEATVLVTALLLERGVARVISRAQSETEKQILERLGVHEVVMPHHEMAKRLAHALYLEGTVDFVELPDGYCLKQVPVPAGLVGHTLAEASMRQKERVLIIRIRREQIERGRDGRQRIVESLIAIPDGSIVLEEGDYLSVIGSQDAVEHFGGLG